MTLQNLFEVREKGEGHLELPDLASSLSPVAWGRSPHPSEPPAPTPGGAVSLGPAPRSASSLSRHGCGEPCVPAAHLSVGLTFI